MKINYRWCVIEHRIGLRIYSEITGALLSGYIWRKKKSKKSEISVQIMNCLKEEKRKTEDSARLGEYSRGWFWEVALGGGVRDVMGCHHYGLTWAQNSSCTWNFNPESGPGKLTHLSPCRWPTWPRSCMRTARAVCCGDLHPGEKPELNWGH